MHYCICLVWIGVTALLASTGWRIAQRVDPEGDFAAHAVHGIVVCWGVVVMAAFVLGAFGALAAGTLLATVAAVSCVLRPCVRNPRATPADSRSIDPSASRTGWGWPLAWSVVLTFAVVHSIMLGVLTLPDDWDTLMYHLPLVDHGCPRGVCMHRTRPTGVIPAIMRSWRCGWSPRSRATSWLR